MVAYNLLDTSRGNVVVPFLPGAGAATTLTATTDPGVNNDVTTGVVVGTIWFNASGGILREWVCRDNTQGAAKWILGGVDYGQGGANPPFEVTQFGLGTATIAEEGNINRQISAAGITTGANGSDIVLASFSLPANSFDVTGRGITITAQGSFGGTSNNKRIKLIFNATAIAVGGSVGAGNGTVIADTGTITTNGSGWSVQANIFKYGAAGSNTQIALHQQSQAGPAVTPLNANSLITANESAAINILVTGQTTTLINDIVWNFLEINAMN